MPKGSSGGKRGGGGGGLLGGGSSTPVQQQGVTLNLRSQVGGVSIEQDVLRASLPDNASVSQVEQSIMSRNNEAVAIFGNDRRLLDVETGESGEVTLSGESLSKYKDDIRVMTHNHPVDLPLSTGDLLAASKLGHETGQKFEELRAVSSNGNTYRAMRPKDGTWPSEPEINSSIQKNIRPAYEKALRARRAGATKEEAFQLYQDALTQRIAKDTGIRLRNGAKAKPGVQLLNAEVIAPGISFERAGVIAGGVTAGALAGGIVGGPFLSGAGAVAGGHIANNIYMSSRAQRDRSRVQSNTVSLRNETEQLRSLNTGRPTAKARQDYGFKNMPGERPGAFPIFDIESSISALNLRGHTRTGAGRAQVIERARKYAPKEAEIALQRDVQRGVTLQNMSREMLRNPVTGKPTSTARQRYGFEGTEVQAHIPGEKAGAFPIFDKKSARAALFLQRHARTQQGRENIQQRAKQALETTPEIRLQNLTQQVYRTPSGRPTSQARKEFGFTGTEGERRGAFPVFDVQSAHAALRLRGKARTEVGRRTIIEKASHYTPESAQKALQRDIQRQGISLQNVSYNTLRSPVTGKPTTLARQQYGFGGTKVEANIPGEKRGAFPIFDTQSAASAKKLQRYARTEEGRRNITERAAQFQPGISLQNYTGIGTPKEAIRNIAKGTTRTSKEIAQDTATSVSYSLAGATIGAVTGAAIGAPMGIAPVGAGAGFVAGRYAGKFVALRKISKRRGWDTEVQKTQEGMTLKNMSGDMYRTAGGKPTASTRRQYGFEPGTGEKQGSFPIFDAQSARAAINLRGHAKTQAGRADIIKRAAQYDPERAAKAFARDSSKNKTGITLRNVSDATKPNWLTPGNRGIVAASVGHTFRPLDFTTPFRNIPDSTRATFWRQNPYIPVATGLTGAVVGGGLAGPLGVPVGAGLGMTAGSLASRIHARKYQRNVLPQERNEAVGRVVSSLAWGTMGADVIEGAFNTAFPTKVQTGRANSIQKSAKKVYSVDQKQGITLKNVSQDIQKGARELQVGSPQNQRGMVMASLGHTIRPLDFTTPFRDVGDMSKATFWRQNPYIPVATGVGGAALGGMLAGPLGVPVGAGLGMTAGSLTSRIHARKYQRNVLPATRNEAIGRVVSSLAWGTVGADAIEGAFNTAFPKKQQGNITLANASATPYRSLNTGRPTNVARRQFGFHNIPGEKVGNFPIFDVKSAQSALRLRGKAKTPQGRQDIIRRAQQYAPESAQTALQRDISRGQVSGIRLQNTSQSGLTRSQFERSIRRDTRENGIHLSNTSAQYPVSLRDVSSTKVRVKSESGGISLKNRSTLEGGQYWYNADVGAYVKKTGRAIDKKITKFERAIELPLHKHVYNGIPYRKMTTEMRKDYTRFRNYVRPYKRKGLIAGAALGELIPIPGTSVPGAYIGRKLGQQYGTMLYNRSR